MGSSATRPDRYGVMGYPVAQSRSPVIHRLFALQTGQHMQYDLLQVAPEDLESTVLEFRQSGGRGLNVTAPHKTAVLEYTDELSDRARLAGAANTLLFQGDAVFGDNTDGFGLVRDLEINLNLPLAGIAILVLGAGGATRGILGPLLAHRPASLLLANRTLAKAEELATRFAGAGSISACKFRDVPKDAEFDLVINATSAGLKGEAPPFPKWVVSPQTVCYDLSYGLSPTPFSLWAEQQGAARSVMGWGMLVEQAAESFHLWRGVRPDTITVLKQIAVNAS